MDTARKGERLAYCFAFENRLFFFTLLIAFGVLSGRGDAASVTQDLLDRLKEKGS